MKVSAVTSTKQELLGIPVDALTMEEVLDRIDKTIFERGRLRIGVVNAAKLVNMRRNATLRQDVLSSDLILADGMAVVWASRLLGRPLPERMAYALTKQLTLTADYQLITNPAYNADRGPVHVFSGRFHGEF